MAKEEAKDLETPVVEETTTETEEKFAKAGKKSKKHVEEVRGTQGRESCRTRKESWSKASYS